MTKSSVCPLCSSRKVRIFFSCDLGDTYYCSNCTVTFNDIKTSNDALYDAEYFDQNYISREEGELLRAKSYIRLLEGYHQGGSLLDYGCGAGYLLQAACGSSFTNNAGTEISQVGLDLAAKNTRGTVELINVNTHRLPSRLFDVICFADSLSSVPNVRKIICKLRDQHLAKDGIFFIRTSHTSRFYSLLVRYLVLFLPKDLARKFYFVPFFHLIPNEYAVIKFLESMGMTILHRHKEGGVMLPVTWWPPAKFIRYIILSVMILIQARLVIVARVRSARVDNHFNEPE